MIDPIKRQKVALVGDDQNLSNSISGMLCAEGYEVVKHDDSKTAVDFILKESLDLVIMDFKQPPLDATEILRQVRQKSSLAVILLSDSKDELDEIFALKLGADDFISVPVSNRLLLERIKAVLRRTAASDLLSQNQNDSKEQIIERGDLVINQEKHSCTWKGKSLHLTVTEFLILRALAQRPGVVKTRDSLMDIAYDGQIYVDDRTIDSHLKRIRKKFNTIDPDFNMIQTIYGVGYRFREI